MTSLTLDPPAVYKTDAEAIADFDAALARMVVERDASLPSIQEIAGEYQKVEGKPGLYFRPMCIESELRAMELIGGQAQDTASFIRACAEIASLILFKANPARLRDWVLGNAEEAEVFVPLTVAEVSRRFRVKDLLDKVLRPAGFDFGGEEVPNADAPTG